MFVAHQSAGATRNCSSKILVAVVLDVRKTCSTFSSCLVDVDVVVKSVVIKTIFRSTCFSTVIMPVV